MPITKKKEKILKLNSPVGLSPVVYRWPLQSQEGYDEAHELIESMRWVCHDFPNLRVAVENYILDRIDLSDFDRMSQMCNRFNRAADNIRRLGSGIEPPKCIGAPPSRELLKHIMVQVYNRSIPDPDKLNSYEPFSPEVYGESSYDLVADIIAELKLTEDDVFLDLGSGVGNVVLQVTAAANCTCYGIEKNEIPASYAKEMEEEFLQWMDWYGKSFGDFELLQGDFLEADNYSYIKKATVIFVNNFAFGPRLNHKLKEIFSGLADGTRIVTSLELAPVNFKVTPRTLSDLGSILRVSQLSATEGNVSWTVKPVSYYLHVIDRTKLEKYFLQQKRRGDGESSVVSEARPKRKRRKQTKKSGRRKRKATTSSEESVSLTPTDPSDFYMSSEDNCETQDEMRASLDVLVETYRKQMTEFLDKMQTKEFKDQLLEQIELEKERKLYYTEKIAEMEEKIHEILNDGANSIRKVMTEFGIENQTPMGLTNGARAMLVQNRQLKEDTRVLEERVTKLEEEHKELLRDCKDSMGEEVFAPVASRLDMYMKCHDPKLIDWNSPLVHINPSWAASVVKPPSHPLTPLRKHMRNPKKKTIRLLKQKDKQNSSQASPHSTPAPPSVTQIDHVIEQMDTAQPLLPTSSTAPSEQTLEETEVLSKPLLKQDQQTDLSTITISSSPSPPHETSFSIKSITRPSREKTEKTTLIPSPTSSLAPVPPNDIPVPSELVSPIQQPVLTPRSSTFLHPFFPCLQNNPVYLQYLEKQSVPYPFYPIALSQQQIMNMYYSQLSPDKIASPPRPPGPLPHMPLTNFPIPTFSPELLAVRDSGRSKQKRSDKSKRRHHKDPNHISTTLETSMVHEKTPSSESIATSKCKQENEPETGIETPIYTPTLPDNT